MSWQIERPATAFNTSRRAKETAEIRDERHLAWIRTLPSVISGQYCCQAAHVSFADRRFGKSERAKSKKADDCWVLPLCSHEHEDQHAHNERAWWESKGIDPNTLASRLWAVSGDTEAALEIINQARLDAAVIMRRK